jgi:hypothetical protein
MDIRGVIGVTDPGLLVPHHVFLTDNFVDLLDNRFVNHIILLPHFSLLQNDENHQEPATWQCSS